MRENADQHNSEYGHYSRSFMEWNISTELHKHKQADFQKKQKNKIKQTTKKQQHIFVFWTTNATDFTDSILGRS